MSHNWMKLSLVPLLSAALWVTGCTDRLSPAGQLLGPDAASFAKDKAEKPKKGKKVKVRKKDGSTGDLTLVQARMPVEVRDRTVSKEISGGGGTLSIAGHTLSVPEGAVSQNTMFTMRVYKKVVDKGDPKTSKDDEVAVGVELKAVAYDCTRDGIPERSTGGSGCVEFDIGEAGFNGKQVELTLSYDGASNVATADQANSIVVIWIKDNGEGQDHDTVRNTTAQTATARLNHFSDYLLAMP